jgi:hypothetical protein
MHSELWWGKTVDKGQLETTNKFCGVRNSKNGSQTVKEEG